MSELETVIGLEIHAELKTASKLFCSCPSRFGAPPNQSVCPICMGHPGAMPSLNRRAVSLAVRAGLALNCTVAPLSQFDRKHYAYPDLPKAYQITQFFYPLCTDGTLSVNGKNIRITRIHMEEDAGKLLHDSKETRIDYNRCGVPLIEIVTAPDFHSAKDAADFCRKLRRILLFAGVCDGKMNEGSLRCDVNLSIHRKSEPLGERTEIKNLNSFKFIEKAICAEEARQTAILNRGGTIERQTLRFDEKTGQTIPMRDKEDAADYRYFPEPDLLPLRITPEQIEAVRQSMPPLPDEIQARFSEVYRLSDEVSEQLLSSPEIAEGFEACARLTAFPLICGRLYAACVKDAAVDPVAFAALSDLAGNERISYTDAKILAAELTEHALDPIAQAEARGMLLIFDEGKIKAPLAEILAEYPDKVQDYKEGKTALLGFFIGALKRRIDFPASPKLLSEAVLKKLNEITEESSHE